MVSVNKDFFHEIIGQAKTTDKLELYKRNVDCMHLPTCYGHEPIFRLTNTDAKSFFQGLLADMSAEEKAEAIELLNPEIFDFMAAFEVGVPARRMTSQWC